MIDSHLFEQAGEHSLMLHAHGRQVEASLVVPQDIGEHIVILGHPHSLQGGTMQNKVVTTLSRSFRDVSIPSLRFNFRGVGQSEGQYDAGIGESEDMLALVEQLKQAMPDKKLIFAGFSFGSYVACRAASQVEHELLISVAPPVHHYDYNEFEQRSDKWLVLMGNEDEVVPYQQVIDFCVQKTPPLDIIEFDQTGHFFHGKLIQLRQLLIDNLQKRLAL